MSENHNKLLFLSVVLILVAVILFWLGLKNLRFEAENPVFSEVAEEESPEASEEAELREELLPNNGEVYRVSKVVDGDTIVVAIGDQTATVRFIGIDTPETVDPRRPVGCFGKEASNETHRLLDGQSVVLIKDITDRDKYQRLLRYVFLINNDGNWLFVNDYLVRNGFAKSYTYPPDVKYQEQFIEGEKEARENGRGLWGAKCQ